MPKEVKHWFMLSALLLSISGGLLIKVTFSKATTREAPRPRFEVVYTESLDCTNAAVPCVASEIHDLETGNEIICFRDSGQGFKASISCFQTGRKW